MNQLSNIINQLSKRQKIILSVYFILGLPGLPLAVIMLLMQRYLFEFKELFQPENRGDLAIFFCSYMITFTIFGGLIGLLVHFLN